MKADRLAEIRAGVDPNVVPGLWYHHDVALQHIRFLLDRIAELERLVPDQVILECAAFIMRTGYGDAENCPAKLEEYATDIRKYREEGK